FFSSRRRHTRSYGDWSSDVCSSDLLALLYEIAASERREVCAHVGVALLQLGDGARPEHASDHRGVLRRPPLARGQRVEASTDERSEERRVGKEGRCGGGEAAQDEDR